MNDIPKKMTIKEIAEIAGVSKSTVSRAIDGNPRISDETKSKIFDIIEKYGYTPNTAARNLARNKTNAVGIVMPHGESGIYAATFFQEALKGICNTVSNSNYDVLITAGNPTEPEAIKRLINTSRVDGIILLRSKLRDTNIELMLKSQFPFVLIGSCKEYSNIYSIDNDNISAASALTEHILESGRRKIAFIGGVGGSMVTINRLEGYKKKLLENGLGVNEDYIHVGEFSEKHGYESMKRLMSLCEKPDGLITVDDTMCMGAMRYLEGINVKVPGEMAVACFNDSAYTRFSRPSITTVTVDSYQLGSLAAETLISVLNNKNVDYGCRYMDYKILERESTSAI